MNVTRFQELNHKVRNGTATSDEKLEFMRMLKENKSLSQSQYDNYENGIRNEELLKIGLIIGGALVLTWAIKKLVDGQQ